MALIAHERHFRTLVEQLYLTVAASAKSSRSVIQIDANQVLSLVAAEQRDE